MQTPPSSSLMIDPPARSSPIVHQMRNVVGTTAKRSSVNPNDSDSDYIDRITEKVRRNPESRNAAYSPSQDVPLSPALSSVSSIPLSQTPPSSGEDIERRRVVASMAPRSSYDAGDRPPGDFKSSNQSPDGDLFAGLRNHLDIKTGPQRRARKDSVYTNDDWEGIAPHADGGDHDVTPMEKIWQPLFQDGKPTARLGQLLRGLGKYLIDEYQSKFSLVVTPRTMLTFFKAFEVDNEQYPFSAMFGGKMSNESIETMYRKLDCQYHLVQNLPQDRPTLPGLTPLGFEVFMTNFIQADPDVEFIRLAKVVQSLPINNADNHQERFPKELPRKLLPAQPERQAEQRVMYSLQHEERWIRPRSGSNPMPPPPSSAPPPSDTHGSGYERNYSFSSRHRSKSIAEEEEEEGDGDVSPTVFAERSRKPYHAKEGSGRIYTAERDGGFQRGPRTDTTPSPTRQYRYDPVSGRYRSNPRPPSPRSNPYAASGDANSPPPLERRRVSMHQPNPNPASTAAFRRASSPATYGFRRGEPGEANRPQPRRPSGSSPLRSPLRPPIGEGLDDHAFDLRHRPPQRANTISDDRPATDQRGRPSGPTRRRDSESTGYGLPPDLKTPAYAPNVGLGRSSTASQTRGNSYRRNSSWGGDRATAAYGNLPSPSAEQAASAPTTPGVSGYPPRPSSWYQQQGP